MYYTSYFKGVDISSLTSVCETCINSLRTAGNTAISFSGILENNLSNKLETALADNKSEIDSLISALETYKSALTIASEIVSKQKAMESEEATTAIASASEVQTKLKSFCDKMDELDTFSALTSSISGLSSYEFKANPITLDNAKSEFNGYSNNLVTGYDTLEGAKSNASVDAYLYKGWISLINRYDSIMKKRDNLDKLLTSYIENLKVVENSLPTTKAITNFAEQQTTTYAKDHSSLNSDTSYDAYSKAGRGEEITIPATDPYDSSSGSPSYTVNNDGTVTYKDSNGNAIATTAKDITGLSDYEIAQYKARGYKTDEEIVAAYNKDKANAAAAKYKIEKAQAESNYKAAIEKAEAEANRRAKINETYDNLSDYQKAQYKAQGYNTKEEIVAKYNQEQYNASKVQAASNYKAAQAAAAEAWKNNYQKSTSSSTKTSTTTTKTSGASGGGWSAGVPGGNF